MSEVQPEWIFLWEIDESPGDRIARCCVEALRDGPMGRELRAAHYREVVDLYRAGGDPERPDDGVDLGTVRTSCGIFVRAMLHWSGLPAAKPGRRMIGGALVGGWVPLTFGHPAFVDARKGQQPKVGAPFYRAYSLASSGREGHVGIFVEHLGGDRWRTAEGGGNDSSSRKSRGTVCRLSGPEGKDVRAKDSLGRVLCGWWDPDKLGLEPWPQTPDTEPAPPPESSRP